MDDDEKQLKFKLKEGPVLSHVHLSLIYWGSRWKEEGDLMSHVTESVRSMVDGDYLSQLSQYNVPAGQPFEVRLVAAVQDYDSDPPNPFADSEKKGGPSDVRNEITRLIDGSKLGPPSDGASQALYMVIMPKGVTCSTADDDDEDGAGQHFYFEHNGQKVYYGWSRSGASDTALERITSTLSEEIVEAITDPEPGKGWVASATGEDVEVCDVCQGVNLRVDGVLVRAYYSNRVQDCVAGKAAPLRVGELAKPAVAQG